MYNKILVPLDGSKAAEAVLPHVEISARALQLPVDLIHVTDAETVSPSVHTGPQADYLKQLAASCLKRLPVNCSVKSGSAAEVILDSASADLGILIDAPSDCHRNDAVQARDPALLPCDDH